MKNGPDPRAQFDSLLEAYNTAIRLESDEFLSQLEDLGTSDAYFANETIMTQNDIIALQKEKRDIMDKLKSDLRALESGELVFEQPSENHAKYHQAEDGSTYFTIAKEVNGQVSEYSITQGDIASGVIWGLDYSFTPDTPAIIQKEYLVRKARHDIQTLYDEQVAQNFADSQKVHRFKREAYRAIYEMMTDEDGKISGGHLAEKVALSMMTKISLDATDTDSGVSFTVKPEDPFGDVELKTDFRVIARQADEANHRRGVLLEAGIQFTTMTEQVETDRLRQFEIQRGKRRRSKTEQLALIQDRIDRGEINDIDSVALVRADFNAWSVYKQWQADRPPHGPEYYLAPELQRAIAKQSLENIYDEETLASYISEALPTDDPRAGTSSVQRAA